ncbi:hypothetical protein V6N13_021312 [Hibiscus sabdariffa]|uniref:Glycosyltransferases n=1 Tax=Hibiscus sabdariffa TaxID=183260 RepID=A0ABR2NPZ2_9ROSI
MKLSTSQQGYLNRRSNSFRLSIPLESDSNSGVQSPTGTFRLILHCLCCLICVVLGFHFSRLVPLLLSTSTNLYTSPFRFTESLDVHSLLSTNPINDVELSQLNSTGTYSRVVVGRHGIRVRQWPHPNPTEVMKAHRIIERVQREQRLQFDVKDPRKVIVVTPTYVRSFQALHLTGLMHSLMLVPYGLVWIVVEVGGVSNETASLIAKSGLQTIHAGFNQRMPNSWDERTKLESQMRLHALRIVREMKLDGIVMFADDSNVHTMELFDEIQNLKWFGAVSVGILVKTANANVSADRKNGEDENHKFPVQGPSCNATGMLTGWYTFNSLPFAGKTGAYIGHRATVSPRKFEWSGFVFNSRLLWKDGGGKPDWIKDIDTLDGDIDSPLCLVKDRLMVEPLGSCGRQVLVWWLRVEAHADSKFPPSSSYMVQVLIVMHCRRWIIDPPLEISIPSECIPSTDAHPELPANEKPATNIPGSIAKHTKETRTSRNSTLLETSQVIQTFLSDFIRNFDLQSSFPAGCSSMFIFIVKLRKRGSERESNMSESPATATATATATAAEKKSWPELVGKDGECAKKTIESENPNLTVIVARDGSPMTMDFRTNRVRVWVDEKGLVVRTPTVG